MLPAVARRPRAFPWSAPLLLLFGCGARTPIDTVASSAPDAGGAVVPDSGGVSAPLCHSWAATTQSPIQVSNIGSIVELQSALPTSAGVLVGFADEQFPPVDPGWHVRLVSFDGKLDADQTPFTRNPSGLGWTRVSVAVNGTQFAATASDDSQGMLFVPTDGDGASTGTVSKTAGNPGRFMLGAGAGYSVLRSPFDDSGALVGPVSLATLDLQGQVTNTRLLLEESASFAGYARAGYPDGSFLFFWYTHDACAGCSTFHVQHDAANGAALAPPTAAHAFGANEYGTVSVATSASGFLAAWTEGSGASFDLLAQPFDPDGQPTGSAARFAQNGGQNQPVVALTAAPGGFLAAWADGAYSTPTHLYVQSVAPDGTAGGATTTLTTIATSEDGTNLFVVATPDGAMVLYEDEVPLGIEVFALPLHCVN